MPLLDFRILSFSLTKITDAIKVVKIRGDSDDLLRPRPEGESMIAPPSQTLPLLSATVICRDEEERIEACLRALRFCDEIVVVDGGSRDRTPEIARRHADRVISNPFEGTNRQKEFARQAASGTWVLNVDADEIVSIELAEEIRKAVQNPTHSGYRIPFRTFINERPVRFGPYFRERHGRLVLRERACWDVGIEPHDRIHLDGNWGDLRQCIHHYTASALDELEGRALSYGRRAAENLNRQGKRVDALSAHARPWWRFFRTYVLRLGFLDGERGLRLARIQAREAAEKYARFR